MSQRSCTRSRVVKFLILLAVPALTFTDAAADAGKGSISGTVAAESTGEAVRGALIVVVGPNIEARTNAVGRFTISEVPAGTYEVVFSARGFAEMRRAEILVSAGTVTRIEVLLPLTPNFMERVQVTASKQELSIGDVPALASVIDRRQIEARGDLELTQAISNVPGLVVSSLLTSFESVMLRGMPRTGNEWTTTLLLVDGVPQTDSRNSGRVINLPINDTSSIEVVRGPNSALYGRTAIGGTVNVRTAEPTADPSVGLDIQVGQFDHLKGEARASGPVSDWGGYYVSWAIGRNHGFHKQDFLFQTDENAVFGKFTFTPDSKSHGSVSFNNVVSNNAVHTPIPLIDGRLLSDIDPRFNRLANVNVPTANYHQNELRTAFNYTRNFTDRIQFTEVFGYRAIQYKFEDDGDVIGAPFDLAAQTFTMYPFDQKVDEDIFYQEARFRLRPKLGEIDNSLVVGVSYEATTGFGSGNLIYTDEDLLGWPVNYVDPVHPDRSDWQFFRFGGDDYGLNILGVFGQYILDAMPRLSINVGGRYDRLDLDNVRTFSSGRPRIEKSFDAFSPKVSATLKLVKPDSQGAGSALNLYSVYSEAFLPPRRPNSLRPLDQAIRLEPEEIRNYEVGLKGAVAQGKVSFEAVYFRMTRDGIVVQTREGPFFRDSNAGVQEFRGVELGVTWRPIENLSLYANGAFYENRFGDFVIQSASGDVDLTGNRLPISPDRVYNAGLSWEHKSGLDFTTSLKHVGEVALDQGNTFFIDPYTVLNAAVSLRRGPMRLTVSAHNLLNEAYYNMGDISLAESIDPAAPRQVVATASFSFK